MQPTSENILSVYRRATNDAYVTGLSWYDDANSFARLLDPANPNRGAGIIAALSPVNHWDNNKAKASLLYVRNGIITFGENNRNEIGLSKNVRKAMAIYNGAEPLDVLGGDKVRAFYATIVNPYGDVIPVIDRHAYDIAVGVITNDRQRGTLSRKGEYERFADVYRETAVLIGIGAPQLQAITWLQWRGEKGPSWLN